eukprot:45542-Rhodomonas_salina.1
MSSSSSSYRFVISNPCRILSSSFPPSSSFRICRKTQRDTQLRILEKAKRKHCKSALLRPPWDAFLVEPPPRVAWPSLGTAWSSDVRLQVIVNHGTTSHMRQTRDRGKQGARTSHRSCCQSIDRLL